MADFFPVPDGYRDQERSPQRLAWCDWLPRLAATLADRWGLTPDGEPMYGFLSFVWPVRDRAARPLMLKVHDFSAGADGERLALEAARRPALVELVASDPGQNALLLERLDSTRRLETMADVDAACEVIGDLVAQISAHDAPPEMRSMATELDRLHASTTAMLDRTPDVMPRLRAERALETMGALAEELRATSGPLPLVHGDAHYLNVLHTLPGEEPRWVAIDPLPAAGYPEWEVAAVLRNRWSDAAATADPERALRRRFDILCERADLNHDRALRLVHAIAVDNVLWLARDDNAHPVAKEFIHPYSIVARW
ncbi:MAG: aminoglycoside phosphotransferase family protein [Lapillicoccus sp.]